MKTSEMDYGRAPTTPGYTKLIARLNLLSGWKKRDTLQSLATDARTDFSSYEYHANKKDWANALVCLEDGIAKAEKIKRELKS